MDNHETNRMNMIRTTHDYCVAKAAATAGIPQYVITVTAVKNKITLIDALNIIAGGTTTGVTLDTNLLRQTMSDIAYKCASATFAYASSVNNNTLKAQVDFPRSSFEHFKKEEVNDICQGIHDATNTNIVAVTPFGAKPLDVTDLQTAINLYAAAMQGPRQARISISSAIDQIKTNVSDTLKFLLGEQLDKMTDTLKLSNKIYYNEYYLAREIIDLGSTHGKLRGTISDNSGNALSGAVVIMRLTGQAPIAYQATTKADGKYVISPVTVGDYDISVEAVGFQPYAETNVHFGPGKEIRRTISLLPV
ncbi:MAG: carboxypeptidase regulatory-like domain-containing protein [Bacteroidia bacterium]|nr:carboxypeptidase regulatory-like domain-containing protein [Bacteroidia bacterium]